MRIVIPDTDESAVTDGVSWEQLEELLDELGETRAHRLAYSDRRLEITSPSRFHERIKLRAFREWLREQGGAGG